MRHARFARFLLCLALLSAPRAVRAETDLEAGERLYLTAQGEEAKLELGAALADYDASLARAPSGRWALAARARADDLRGHSEGGFGPLVILERTRRGPQTNEAMDGLAREAAAFPDGPVRGEARMLAAEAFLSRLARPADGERLLSLVLGDPSADPTLRRFAARRTVDLALAEGRTADARGAALRAGDPDLDQHVSRALRRGALRKLAAGAIAANVALAFLALAGAWRKNEIARAGRALASRGLFIGAFSAVAASGGILASAYERGHALPFVAVSAATGVLAAIALAWSSVGSSAAWARGGRAALCAAAVAGAGFLVLDRIDASYLEGFGL